MATSKVLTTGILAAAAIVAGCSDADYRSEADQRIVRIDPDGPERRADVSVAPIDREARSDGEVAGTSEPSSVASIPAEVHAAAMKEVPGGDVTSAECYAVGEVDVFDLRIAAADGPHEVKVRDDGVVLLHRREVATEVASVPSVDGERIASRP